MNKPTSFNIKLIVLITILLIIPTASFALDSSETNQDNISLNQQTEIYVSLTGNNDNNGTIDSPKLTLDGENGAISYANSKNITTIILDNGTFKVNNIKINQNNYKLNNLTIIGSGSTIISGNNSNLFTIGLQNINSKPVNITFYNIDFTNSSYYLPALSIYHSYLTIINCNFYDNLGSYATCIGNFYNSTTTINDSKFFNNRDEVSMACIVSDSGGYYSSSNNVENYVYIDNCQFYDNIADTGVISNNPEATLDSIMLITNSNFTNNYGLRDGGAIFNIGPSLSAGSSFANLSVMGCNFINNTAGEAGGAIFTVGDSILVVENSTFINNSVPTDLTIDNSAVGGAIFAGAGSVRLYNSIFNQNTAGKGGAIFNTMSSDIIITNTTFNSNEAIIGGAVYMDLPNDYGLYSSFNNLTFNNNTADLGEALFTNDLNEDGGHYLVLDCKNSNFNGNSVYNVGNFVLLNSNFNNSNIYNTGVLFTENNTYINSSIINNTQKLNIRFLNNVSGYLGDVVKIKANVSNIFSKDVIIFTIGLTDYVAYYNQTSGLYEYDYEIMTGHDQLISGYSLVDNNSTSNNVYVKVLKHPVNLILEINNTYLGDNINIGVYLSFNNTLLNGNVEVSLNGKQYNVFVKNGYGNLSIANTLNVGTYTAIAKYGKNSFIYEYTENTTTFNVTKKDFIIVDNLNGVNINIGNISAYYGDNVVLLANLTKDDLVAIYTKTLQFKINNEIINGTYNNETKLYEANWIVNQNKTSEITINTNDTAIINEGTFTLLKRPVNLTLSIKDTYIGENINIGVYLSSNNTLITGDVFVLIEGNDYTVNVENGYGNLSIANTLNVGTYTAKASFGNNSEIYQYTENTTSFNITKKDFIIVDNLNGVNINIGNLSAYYRDNVVLLANLTKDDLVAIYTKTLQFKINNEIINGTYNNETKLYEANWIVNQNKTSEITINTNDAPIINEGTFTLLKHPTNLSVNIPDIIFNKTALIANITLTSEGKGIDGIVKLTINGNSYDVNVVGGKGEYKLYNLNIGNYTAISKYEGSNLYDSANTTTDFKVLIDLKHTSLISQDIQLYYKNGTRFYATLVDCYNRPIANQEIIFNINGVDNKRVTDSNGKASIAINLNPGSYPITTKFAGTDKYDSVSALNTVNVLSTIEGKNIVKMYKNGTNYYAKFLDNNGNPLVGQGVRFNINGVFYERITDSNGIAKLTINLQPDTYILTAYNLFNGEASSNTIKVLSTIEGNNLTKYFQNASRYNAKFYNEDGTPLVGAKVIFNINGVFYEKTTNSEGIASLNINLRQGEYIITATNPINGQMYSNIVTVLPTLVADNLVMYYKDGSQFKVTALDGHGNPAIGVDISMNVNGIFYYRTTKADGTAYLTINLIPGEYIITSYFGQESISNLITIFNR